VPYSLHSGRAKIDPVKVWQIPEDSRRFQKIPEDSGRFQNCRPAPQQAPVTSGFCATLPFLFITINPVDE